MPGRILVRNSKLYASVPDRNKSCPEATPRLCCLDKGRFPRRTSCSSRPVWCFALELGITRSSCSRWPRAREAWAWDRGEGGARGEESNTVVVEELLFRSASPPHHLVRVEVLRGRSKRNLSAKSQDFYLDLGCFWARWTFEPPWLEYGVLRTHTYSRSGGAFKYMR